MAKKILIAYNFNANEIQNARMHNVAGTPSTPGVGQMWFDTSAGLMKWQNNSGAIDPLSRANHSGTQLSSTISDLAATVQAFRLDQFAAPTAALNINSQKLTNVTDPTNPQDAATKNYVDGAINGTDWKASVRAASVGANLTLSAPQTIDGVAVVAGDRVLVKDQTTASANGIYVVAAGAWARAADATTNAQVTADLAVFVEEGTVNADTQWRLTTNAPITVGTTSLTFAQIGAGTSYTAGTGISIAGSSISVDATVVAKKAAATIGDGSATSITVTHNLGTQDVIYSLRQVSDNAFVEADAVSTSTTQITFTFAVAPAASAIRATIHG